MSRFEWPIAVLCMLLCAVECHLYCIVPSDNALCTCQDLCLTLSEISINITYYLESNTTLIFQPGNHNLDSNLVISNISVLKLYSDEPSANRIVCTPFTNIHFIEVSKVVISGLEFIACGSSIVRAVHFELLDTILTSENGSSTALMLSEIMAANIVSCSFKGVTVSIVHQSFVTINSVSIFDSSASLAALAVYNSSVEFIGFTRLMNNQRALLAYNAKIWFIGNTTFSNCTITNNDSHVTMPYGDGGGAINSYLSHLIFQGSTTFVLNSAKHGGAIFAVESLVMITRNNDHLTPSSSIFTQAGVVIVNNNIGRTTGGGMYLYYSRLIVRNDLCHLIRNDALEKGGAIHAVHSYIKLESRDMCKDSLLMLEKNSARLGGGIYLEGASRITLSVSNSSVAFIENSADYGAAIYVDDYTKYDTCHATSRIDIAPDTSCFISMCDPYLITPTILSTVKESIVLYNNTAKYSGANLFGGLLDRCVPPSVGNATSKGAVNGLFSDGLTYLQTVSNINDSDTGSITSHPMKVCFCNQSLPNCSLRTHTMEVQKGQPFTLSLATVDQVGAPVSGKIVAYLSSTQGSLGGGHIIELTDACTDLNYTVFSSDESDVLNMYADGPCGNADLSRLTVTLKFTTCTCPVGFQLSTTNNRTSCECICDPLIYPEYISSCSIQPEPLIERKSNIWINPETTHETNETIYKVGSFCPFGRCLGETHINLNTEAGIAAQCISTIYEGELCSTCSATYSISLGGKRCVKCPDIWPLSFIAIILGSLLAGLGLVVSIMAMNFTVAVGTINGFIFYANIIDVFDMFYLPFYQPNFPDILIEWLNLDPGIDVCFFPGHDIYHRMWIRLLFPLYIVSILFGIIFVSRHSVRFSHFIGNKKPIAVLATLMLLSYTHFLQTALLVLIPSTIKTVAQLAPMRILYGF